MTHSERVELATAFAEVMTEDWGKAKSAQVWKVMRGVESYTREAQAVFNKWYDWADQIILSVMSRES